MTTKTLTKAQIEAERILENRRLAFSKRVRNLLGHVGTRTSQKLIDARFFALSDAERVDYGAKADALATELAAAEPVGRALMPQKVDAVRSAAEDAQRVIDRVMADLEKHGWDINAAAPRPSTWAANYKAASAKRGLYSRLSESLDNRYRTSGPDIVKADPKGHLRFISDAEQDAALQYDAFICKMVGKVGEVTDATIEGEHVWGHSILTVTLPSGEVQRWKTQQIVNYSVYGTPYLQWPSRIVK
jgi:hypothetical protein